MCQFLSVLILRNGDVLHHPMLDSHSDLVTYFTLPDTDAYVSHFAKAELTPVDWADAATWTWRIDEPTVPVWLDADIAVRAEAATRAIANRMILRDGKHRLIVDGSWIVVGTAHVRDVRAGLIRRVQDSAQVTNVWGSAQVTNVMGSARVTNVMGSAQVTDVRGSAQVTNVWGSAQVTNVRDSAQVTNVRDSARVTNVRGSAQVTDVRGSAQVTDVSGSAQVTNVRGSAQVTDVRGSAHLDDSAKAHLVTR